MPTLFDPITLGELKLPNRILMAPLTRCRAEAGRVPGKLMLEYYKQRTSAGLIFSEATSVTPMGVGYPDTPGIWSAAQVAGWQPITQAVHAAGGQMLLQLWHVGRISDPSYLDGELPVAPSAVQPAGHVSLIRPKKDFVTPRALDITEIPHVVEAFRHGAENARRAGFDGVEIHSANGYLIDQFLQTKANRRTDAYGGPIENRARLLLEIVDAVTTVWPAGRVGVHLAPRGDSYDMGDADPAALFGHVAEALGARHIAFICTREHAGEDSLAGLIRARFSGAYIANEAFDQQQAESWVESGRADAVAFGKLFIANPDLPQRFARSAALNPPRPELFFAPGAEGYIDYPFMADVTAPA
ncbi:MAG: alkene reductase [Nevskiaceae bacterium]|nr:MAG: alkene reductase [Nevskiaceae bacterium]TBR74850.1 MAG: alkene reductase [Nevskiaceae bacterium]